MKSATHAALLDLLISIEDKNRIARRRFDYTNERATGKAISELPD
jgi:hypothetical protein